MKGFELSRRFFREAAEPILNRRFPSLRFSAGLLGYGSDVIGYDDEVSRDHMWGPRFYLFLRREGLKAEPEIRTALREELPAMFLGFPVGFGPPNEGGIRAMEATEARPDPLIFIYEFGDYLFSELGIRRFDGITPLMWLSFQEHRLLSLQKGELFRDDLGLQRELEKITCYPEPVRLYLIMSQWDIIASEQAFVKRTGSVGDEIGSRIICARMCERIMRLCFLYAGVFAPYSKWFGSAFRDLDTDQEIKREIREALRADDVISREKHLVSALRCTAYLHNAGGWTEPVSAEIEAYYDRDILVIWADRIAAACRKALKGTGLEDLPAIGSVSQIGGLSEFADKKENHLRIRSLYLPEDAR